MKSILWFKQRKRRSPGQITLLNLPTNALSLPEEKKIETNFVKQCTSRIFRTNNCNRYNARSDRMPLLSLAVLRPSIIGFSSDISDLVLLWCTCAIYQPIDDGNCSLSIESHNRSGCFFFVSATLILRNKAWINLTTNAKTWSDLDIDIINSTKAWLIRKWFCSRRLSTMSMKFTAMPRYRKKTSIK